MRRVGWEKWGKNMVGKKVMNSMGEREMCGGIWS